MGHRNIIGLYDRPFSDIEEMERAIVNRHNAIVGPDDEVYDLGDFAYRCPAEHAVECLRALNGRRTMLWGNHDKPLRQAVRRGLLDDLVGVGKITFVGDPDPKFQTGMNVVIENQRIVLAHYAQRTWQGSFRGAWHLYGHSHSNLPPLLGVVPTRLSIGHVFAVDVDGAAEVVVVDVGGERVVGAEDVAGATGLHALDQVDHLPADQVAIARFKHAGIEAADESQFVRVAVGDAQGIVPRLDLHGV